MSERASVEELLEELRRADDRALQAIRDMRHAVAYAERMRIALLEFAKKRPLTPQEEEAQRRSFAYGNAHIENEHVTRETIAIAAEKLATARRANQLSQPSEDKD